MFVWLNEKHSSIHLHSILARQSHQLKLFQSSISIFVQVSTNFPFAFIASSLRTLQETNSLFLSQSTPQTATIATNSFTLIVSLIFCHFAAANYTYFSVKVLIWVNHLFRNSSANVTTCLTTGYKFGTKYLSCFSKIKGNRKY